MHRAAWLGRLALSLTSECQSRRATVAGWYWPRYFNISSRRHAFQILSAILFILYAGALRNFIYAKAMKPSRLMKWRLFRWLFDDNANIFLILLDDKMMIFYIA